MKSTQAELGGLRAECEALKSKRVADHEAFEEPRERAAAKAERLIRVSKK